MYYFSALMFVQKNYIIRHKVITFDDLISFFKTVHESCNTDLDRND
jgi:hypothetical protein